MKAESAEVLAIELVMALANPRLFPGRVLELLGGNLVSRDGETESNRVLRQICAT
ncbi:hypothetical protein ACVIGB_000441 [Bradyrhizobium sp. USDA 4341]